MFQLSNPFRNGTLSPTALYKPVGFVRVSVQRGRSTVGNCLDPSLTDMTEAW